MELTTKHTFSECLRATSRLAGLLIILSLLPIAPWGAPGAWLHAQQKSAPEPTSPPEELPEAEEPGEPAALEPQPEGGIGAPPTELAESKTSILPKSGDWKGERVDIAAGQIDVLEFLRFLADYTGLPVIVDSTNPQLQTQSLLIAAPMFNITADIVIALLKANKFLVTREKLTSGEVVLNVQSQQGGVAAGGGEPKANPLIQVEGGGQVQRVPEVLISEIEDIRPDEISTMVFTLKYTLPSDAILSLNSLIGGTKGGASRTPAFSIVDVKNSMLIIITAKFGLLNYLEKLLRIIDVPIREPERIIQIINVENADADELSGLIQDFLSGRGGGFNSRRGGSRSRTPAKGKTATTGQGFEEPETNLIPDWRTQKIIVETYSERDLEDIQMLVRELDTRYDIRRLKTHIYQVRYLKAEEVAQDLQSLVGGGSGGRSARGSLGSRQTGSSRRRSVGRVGSRGRTGATATTPGKQGGGQNTPLPALIVPHIQTNSLIIQAEPEDYAEILHILSEIDTKRRQVFLEAALVQVQATSSLTYTIELLAGEPSDKNTRALFESSFGLTGVDFENFNRILNVSPEAPVPPGALFAIMNRGKFPAIVHFFKTNTDSQVLATPFILADDNQPNVIDILETRFVINTASTAAGQTSSQEGEDAGITLEITPTISSEDAVFLELAFEVSAFADTGGAISANVLPPKTTNTITSAVTIPDGDIFVIGGLTRESRSKSISKVPILGDIPIIGKLFRSEASGNSANNLYIFLRAHVLTHEEFADGIDLTQQAQGFVEKFAPELDAVRFDRPEVEKAPAKPRNPDDAQRFYNRQKRSKHDEGFEAPRGPFNPTAAPRPSRRRHEDDPGPPTEPDESQAQGSRPIPRSFLKNNVSGGLDRPPPATAALPEKNNPILNPRPIADTSAALKGTGMEVDPDGESWLVPLRPKR